MALFASPPPRAACWDGADFTGTPFTCTPMDGSGIASSSQTAAALGAGTAPLGAFSTLFLYLQGGHPSPGHSQEQPQPRCRAAVVGCGHNSSFSPKNHEHHLLPSAMASEPPFQAPLCWQDLMKLQLFPFPALPPALPKNESTTLGRDPVQVNGASSGPG